MDFGALLHYAKKKNDAVCKTEGKYYSTKYAPPKKESKESRQLSNNIQKFLKNREAEEQQRKREEREKLNNLLALRDEKSKNKIRKMLKVTKSANKSVLEDANGDNTAMDGADQPDGDDYGYVSTEANAFYQKYIEKVKDVQEDKGFAPSRPQSVRDLSSTKERVKAAITREREEARTHTRQRTSHASSSSISRTTTDKDGMVSRGYNTSSSKTLYDPDAERREEERKRREEEQKKTKVKRATQPPPMDFQALLRLAEKKQHEPVDLALPEKKKEPERLMSAREKKEQEERQRWKEQRAQRERQREIDAKTKVEPTRMEPGGRIPKLNRTTPVGKVASASMPPPSPQKSKLTSDTPKRPASASPSGSSSAKYSAVTTKSSTNQSVTKRLSVASSSSSSSSSNGTTKPAVRAPVSAASAAPSQAKTATNNLKPAGPSRNPYADVNKTGATRSFPPREPSKQIRSGPQGNSPCIKPHSAETRGREGAGGGGAGAGAQRRLVEQINKNRIYDDDSEYDSELDDFIDDGDCEEDISSHIRDIFGYDKRRYRDLDDDDAQMESSFAQVQREEFISKKLGLQEDLEDMRMEAMHKKRKIDKKRPARIHDD